jgi:hypothetical protein
MSNETQVGDLFWAASHSQQLPVVQQEPKASCCGPKPAAKAETSAAPAASSCCGPKAEAAKEPVAAAAATEKSSCCG